MVGERVLWCKSLSVVRCALLGVSNHATLAPWSYGPTTSTIVSAKFTSPAPRHDMLFFQAVSVLGGRARPRHTNKFRFCPGHGCGLWREPAPTPSSNRTPGLPAPSPRPAEREPNTQHPASRPGPTEQMPTAQHPAQSGIRSAGPTPNAHLFCADKASAAIVKQAADKASVRTS